MSTVSFCIFLGKISHVDICVYVPQVSVSFIKAVLKPDLFIEMETLCL